MNENFTYEDLEEYVKTLSKEELMDLINSYCSIYMAHIFEES